MQPANPQAARPLAFKDSPKISTEVHSTMYLGEARSTFVSADTYGSVSLQHCGADLSMRVTLTAAEARLLAAELVIAATAAEKVAE